MDWAADQTLDARGERCPLPVLRARKALLALPPGARLLVVANDPLAAIDVPHFCGESGNRLVASEMTDGVGRFLIERV